MKLHLRATWCPCHMVSHSVTCQPSEVNTPRLDLSQRPVYSIYLPWRDGRLS